MQDQYTKTKRRARHATKALAIGIVVFSVPLLLAARGNAENNVPVESSSFHSEPIPTTPPVPDGDLPADVQGQSPPGRAGAEFKTDFTRATIPFDDILSGGPQKDGIPAVDEPTYVSPDAAAEWLTREEPVLLLEVSSEGAVFRRVYPLQILTWHEIVNDVLGGEPVAVTYCPLCNTGIAFSRVHEETVLDFGTTGRLRYSNLIMYDRQTESWWQQASGRALAGYFAGTRLEALPIMMLPFADAVERYPEATVLSRDTGYSRGYGRNPYVGYDRSEEPFLYRGPSVDETYNPMERVVSIEHNGDSAAVAYSVLEERSFVPLTVGDQDFVVIWQGGTRSALDAGTIAESRDIGSANAFFTETVTGEVVSFPNHSAESTQRSDAVDVASADGTVWDLSGRAVRGPLKGARLRPAAGIQHFWFSHAALVAADK